MRQLDLPPDKTTPNIELATNKQGMMEIVIEIVQIKMCTVGTVESALAYAPDPEKMAVLTG
jgi:hypothetical protein